MQNTPFRINEAIDRLQREAWAAGLPFFDIKKEEQRKGVEKAMKFRFSEASRLSGGEARARAERERDSAKPQAKGEALSDDRFYFPCQVDHRGRAYSVPQFMDPQSDHIGRARIEFADGKPLGERGAYYLEIHLANCYWKGKKASFKTLRAWVREN